MIETLEHQLTILTNEKLSPNELFIIRLIVSTCDSGNIGLVSQFLCIDSKNKQLFRETLLSLQKRGIILSTYKVPNEGEKLDIFQIPFNKNFIKRYHKDSFFLGKELYETYPQFCSINGGLVQINTVSKKYNSLEEAFQAYGRAIGYNPELHQHIIDLVKWGSENNVINCSLASFIVDQRWKALEQLRNGDCGINYNAVKLI